MQSRDRIACAAMTLAIIAFMALSPGYIAAHRQNLTQQHRQQSDESYQGIISLWHIVGFKPYQGSVGAWLEKAAAALEKKHKGVYFEVQSMTLADYEARRERGEKADMYSFPLGWEYIEELQPVDLAMPAMRGNLADSCRYNGGLYGIPYAASGYVLAVNSRIMQEKGLDTDMLRGMIRSGEARASGDEIIACIYGAKGELGDEEDFSGEKSWAAFIDARAAGDMERKVQAGKGFPFEALPCTNYTNLVQYLGIGGGAEEEKRGYILEFMQYALSEDKQRSLMELGLIPAIAAEEQPESETPAVGAIYENSGQLTAPQCFLYAAYEDQLCGSAKKALSGDENAKKDLDLRLMELVQGAAIK